DQPERSRAVQSQSHPKKYSRKQKSSTPPPTRSIAAFLSISHNPASTKHPTVWHELPTQNTRKEAYPAESPSCPLPQYQICVDISKSTMI
ncbi:MAG TPA: hypothetical protein PK156_48755, partial [Polyangium sp.]|nr:hypothetical protein [Polyangium sp.]